MKDEIESLKGEIIALRLVVCLLLKDAMSKDDLLGNKVMKSLEFWLLEPPPPDGKAHFPEGYLSGFKVCLRRILRLVE